MTWSPFIVGVGGTAVTGSSTEQALAHALSVAQANGARTRLLGGATLMSLPHYGPPVAPLTEGEQDFIDTIRAADGLILASPGYHGTVSGLVKNGIDYLEETRQDARVYLDGVPVGLIATAYGSQASVSTLNTLRTIVHALRGWPTPLGVAINSAGGAFRDGQCHEEAVVAQLEILGRQVVQFAMSRHIAERSMATV